MASIINATTSTGLVTTADNSGSLQLATNNGTTALTIDTSQNVGIGTSSPATQLQMNSGAATYSDQLRVRNTNFGNADIGVGSGIMALATDMSNMVFYTSSSLGTTGSALPTNERMRIDSSGDIFAGGSTINGATGSIYSKTNAKAFVQWQGSNGTINQSKNVSSVSRTGTGSYTVVYSITFSTNYVIVLGGSRTNSLSDAFGIQYYGQTSTQVNINTYIPAINFTDAYTADLVIFA
jgi:hypothetical protein